MYVCMYVCMYVQVVRAVFKNTPKIHKGLTSRCIPVEMAAHNIYSMSYISVRDSNTPYAWLPITTTVQGTCIKILHSK